MRRSARKRPFKWPKFGVLSAAFTLLVLVFGIGFLFLKLNTKYWNGTNKLAVVSVGEGGDPSIYLFNPKSEEVYKIIISGDTQVEVANNLGFLRLKNVWQLGKNEGIGGELLAKTVVKNFGVPVYVWADYKFQDNILSGYSTNLKIGDKIALFWFKSKVKNANQVTIDLSDRGILVPQKLKDGEEGLVLKNELPVSIYSLFSENGGTSVAPKVEILDFTGTLKSSERLGRVVESIGGKVVAISKEKKENFNCRVGGGNDKLIELMKKLFSCDVSKKGGNDFDLIIDIGEEFAKRN